MLWILNSWWSFICSPSSLAIAPTQKSLSFLGSFWAFHSRLFSDGEFLLKMTYQLITFCQVYLAMHINRHRIQYVKEHVKKHQEVYVSFSFTLCFMVFVYHLLVPARHQTSLEELQTKFLSTQWLWVNTEHRSKWESNETDRRDTSGDNLGVGRGFFGLFCFFTGWGNTYFGQWERK